jgi:4'-phosphopantetheinyl transferase
MTAASLMDFKLSQDEVHVWCASLKQPAQQVEQFYELLFQDEKDRAGRYYFEHLRQSFIVARGVLRFLLARYTGLQAEQLEFTYQEAGKPQLSWKCDRKIFFNLSHSHEFALYAFSSTRNVGVDLEYIRPADDLAFIAERNFSSHEIAELKTLSPDKTTQGFFNCWTRKEAYIKAIGDGISFPLQEFDVSIKPGEPAKLLSIHGNAQEAARWSMVELYPAVGYAAALVVEGSAQNVVYREWSRLDHFINH